STNATMYPTLVPSLNTDIGVKTSSSKMSFNPSTGMFTVTGVTSAFTGNLTGNASTATSSTSATNTTNTAITDDTSTNATMYPTWVTANTGNLPQKVTSTKMSFNPSTGMFTVTGVTSTFTGNITGNVTGNLTGSVTGAASLNVLKGGDTMSGLLVLSANPAAALGAATKQY